MSKDALIKTPFFIAVVAAIERKVAEGDRIARANKIQLSDAQIVALLTRVAAAARGRVGQPKPARLPKDHILNALAEQLAVLRGSVFEKKIDATGVEMETLFPTDHWVAALKIVQKSIRLGTGKLPGSRSFLDSLGAFLARSAPSAR